MRGWSEARFIVLITILFAAQLASPLRAAREGEPALTADKVDDGDGGFVLNLRNPLPFPITVTVRTTRLENLEPSKAFPITAVVEPQQRSAIAELTPIAQGRRTNVQTHFWWRPGRARAQHDERVVYLLPFQAGYAYHIDQGYNGTFSHQGQHALDFAMPEGTPVCAARDGRVISVTNNFSEAGTNSSFKDKANEFCILHDDGTLAQYAHMKKDGIKLRVGDYVRAGYPLGYSGNTGFSTGPHLHFEVFRAVDGEKSETIPVKFATADDAGPITLQQGRTYMRPYRDQARGDHRGAKNAAELAGTNARIARHGPSAPNAPVNPMPSFQPVLQPRTLAFALAGICIIVHVGRRIGRLL